MNQELAKRLLIDGGTLVILDVPQGTEFGIDMKSWTTGGNFRGVKMIPPGIHFIHYSPIDEYGQVSPKVGFFYNFRKSEFVVRKWDVKEHDLSVNITDENEVVKLKDSITVLDKFLGPYPFDILSKWVFLTSEITENLLKKLLPESGQVRSALDLMSCTDAQRPRKNKSEGNDSQTETNTRSGLWEEKREIFLPDLKPFPGTELRFTTFPKYNYPPGSTPTEITKHSLDSSYVLDCIVKQHSGQIDVIGELQFSYICFLVGNSLEAFEHWKKMISLLCSCDAGIPRYREVYDLFISTLEAQLLEIPMDFLADIVSNNNIVYLKLRNLFRTMKASNVDGRLKSKCERFKEKLTKTYEWDFSHLDSEEEDEAPVVVET